MRNLRKLNGLVVVAAAVSLLGGLLLHIAADPASGAEISFWSLLVGVVLLLLLGSALYRVNLPGREIASEDEVPISESGVGRFLHASKRAAALYVGLRLAMAYEWLSAGWEKLQQPGWTRTGVALQGFWQHAVVIPKTPASPAITYPAYRSLIQFMLDHQWYTWFAKLIVAGELVIGLGLLLGVLTGFAALAGLLMNFNFVYAGSTSVNPTLIILEALVLYGWRVAGWYGLDRFLLLRLGTPWEPGRLDSPNTIPPSSRTGA
jgi:thiosulfate dehydrogenase (quinone) large subunit